MRAEGYVVWVREKAGRHLIHVHVIKTEHCE
jgi:hypothetical protein